MKLPRTVRTGYLAGIGALWLASVAYGFWNVREFESTPGSMVDAPPEWPAESRVPRTHDAAQLVMFIHPRCSCTRASLEELSAALSRLPGTLSAWVVVEGSPPQAPAGDTLSAPLSHPERVREIYDPKGAESRLFGAFTSGHTVLYGATGRLLFSGGITAGRGHVGDNWGLNRLVDVAAQQPSVAATHRVYGCPL